MKSPPSELCDHEPPGIAELSAVAYVVLPVLFFLFQWINLPLGVAASVLFVWGVALPLTRTTNSTAARYRIWPIAIAVLIASAWVMLSGISGHLYSNAFDWIVRFSLARDLSEMEAPARYIFEGQTYLLRAALGFFLGPAQLIRLFGIEFLQDILYVWSVIGVALFFIIAFGRLPIRMAIASCLMFIFCSGLDYYGALLFTIQPPALSSHLEWWAGNLQYSSNTTLLFWVPNHAIAAWIATALLYRFGQHTWFVQMAPALLAALLLWSPLSGAGLALLWFAMHWPNPLKLLYAMRWNFLLVLPALITILLYLTEGVGNIPAGGSMPQTSGLNFIAKVMLFDALEFLVFLPFIVMSGLLKRALPALIILVALPFFSFGPSNDLVLRASIPALTIYWLLLIESAQQNTICLKLQMRLLAFVLPFAVGAMTPIHEMVRAVTSTPWQPDMSLNLPTAFRLQGASTPFPPHYFVRQGEGVLQKVLREKEPE